ncbi:MAG TPA: glycosyltransferase family 39 protein [Prolixibacteraceae bacterium]
MNTGSLDQYGYSWLAFPFLGTLPYAISFKLFGLGLFQARIVSFFFGVILLIAIFFVGWINYGKMTGILAALILSLSQPFIYSSHLARQDIILAAMVVIAYGLSLYALRTEKWWAHLLSGLILGFSIDVHENAALFIPGLAVVYLFNYQSVLIRKRGTWLVAIGGLIGIAYYVIYHILPSPVSYRLINSYWYETSHYMPILALSFRVILQSLLKEIGSFHFYYNSIDFALLGASLIYLFARRFKSDISLLLFILIAFFDFVLFQGVKTDYYAILFYPFLMLLIAEMFVSVFRQSHLKMINLGFIAPLLFIFLCNGFIHFERPLDQNKNYDYSLTAGTIRNAIPHGAKVMGSPTWWMGFSDFDYQSNTGLLFYNFYNGYSLTKGLEMIHPDIIIFDPFMEYILSPDRADSILRTEPILPLQEFIDFLNQRGKMLLDFENPGDGHIQVFSINWEPVSISN